MGWVVAVSRDEVPNVPGVYAIFFRGSLMYIGSSVAMRQRLASHATAWSGLRRFVVGGSIRYRVYRRIGEHLAAEMRLIQRLRPIKNKRLSVRRSDNLTATRSRQKQPKATRIRPVNEHVRRVKSLGIGEAVVVPPQAANAAYCGARYFALGTSLRFSSTLVRNSEGEWLHTVIKRIA